MSAKRTGAKRKWWGLPPWLTKLRAPAVEPARTLQELVKYAPPPAAAVDLVLTAEDKANGWTPETLAEYQAESDARAMAIVATSMTNKRRGRRPRWANTGTYRPLFWRG